MKQFVAAVGLITMAVTGLAGVVLFSSEPEEFKTREFFQSIDYLMKSERYADVQEILIERYPDSETRPADAWLRLGIAHSKSGNLDEAEQCFEKGLKAAPDDERLAFNRALLYIEQDRIVEARRALLALKERAPWFPEVRFHLGWLREQEGDLDAADAWYVEELNMNPVSHSAWRHHMMIDRGLIGADKTGDEELESP